MPIHLSFNEARDISLICQGLSRNKPLNGPLETIKRLGYVQIDTINIIQRAHHHILWSRLRDYQTKQLIELYSRPNPRIFEYWSHAAAYLPIKDYRFTLPVKKAFEDGKIKYYNRYPKAMKQVLKRVEEEGPLMSRDFDSEVLNPDQKWQVTHTRVALAQLVMEGKLMISNRVNFQKVYDLPTRLIPPNLDQSMPTPSEYARFLILGTLQAHGIISLSQLNYLRRIYRKEVKEEINLLAEQGLLLAATVGNSKEEYWVDPRLLEARAQYSDIHLLSPFDNIVIQRKRLKALFNFDYVLECYVPEPKRVFGYFCLPILWGRNFVGRLDPKVDRKQGTFKVVNLVLETVDDQILTALAVKIWELAQFNNCSQVVVERVSPRIKGALQQALVGARS